MQFLYLALAMFVAAFLQATSGFGFALVAMPLVTFVLGLDQAAPLVAVVAMLLNGSNALRQRRHIFWRELLGIGLAGALGVPLGFWLQVNVPEHTVRVMLGVVLVAYALYSLAGPRLSAPHAIWSLPAGFVAGALAGAYNIPGPPVAVYGDLRAWPRERYRSTLQAFFFGAGTLVVGGHVVLGHVDRQVALLIALAVPALFAGNVVGAFADRYLDQARFRKLVLLLILVTGLLLLA